MIQAMKIKNIILGMLSFSVIALSSCEKTFDQLEKDSNRAVQVPASLVLQSIELNVMNDNGRPFSAEMRYNQYYCSNYNYYANNEYNLGQMPNQYTTLKNVVKMEQEAKKLGYKTLKEAYKDDAYYWTEWEVEEDETHYDEDGNEFVKCHKCKEETSVSEDFYFCKNCLTHL